ncbi:DNA methyltransferase [Limosilactobacillus vaginalis]|uniref:DNA methyltransferase n=1 Tax=Limosilactobacillus vaginalis TaxID=1633 RepID=UPI0025A36E81|nr:DNA methyltransferase [Limosilactobacillus vaginalis]MDM8259572.1 N-6 DNA methylase [Limosilactobacillus vaginalis]
MATRQQSAREFVKTWSSPNKGREDADRQTFWNDLLQRVYGINDYYNYITYEKDVQVKAGGKVTTRRIDGYIPSTKVMIEMKGKKVKDLSKPLLQSGGDELTPFEQARRYSNFMKNNEKPNWIIVSNFDEIDIHNMNDNHPEQPTVIKLKDLPNKVKSLDFLVDAHQQQLINERQLSVDAGNLVAKIYDSLATAYSRGRNVDVNDPKIQRSLNMLIVRLVFLFYADDTGILGETNMFQHLLEGQKPEDIRQVLTELFKVLDQPEDKRDPYLASQYNQFTYVNGGMFSDENIIIPQFTPELKDLIIKEAGQGFDWSGISPTIFGAVFESTLNPETRRSGGMHYTSIENIHKVIDPLFLNDLRTEFNKIQNMGNRNQRIARAKEFQTKLGDLKFFDPACGSGNFLTETYLSLRKMENQLLQIIYGNEPILGTDREIVQVKIQNFYGIEINDFAVSVARTAMWIAENQMLEQTKDTVYYNKNFLPLDSNDSIYEGNALRMNWEDIVKPYELNYIMGNPPFVGTKMMNESQKQDTKQILGSLKRYGVLDYVACWFKKASDYISNSTIHASFVATNSIIQGEQVPVLWKYIFSKKIYINFAYKPFVWNNEAQNQAHVHCVIIGFSSVVNKDKILYNSSNQISHCKNINGYLFDGNNVFITNRPAPLSNVPRMHNGCKLLDGGFYTLTSQERKEAISKDPYADKFIRPYLGAKNFIHGTARYCIWLKDANPKDIHQSPFILDRINKVAEFRSQQKSKDTQKYAKRPMLPTRLAYYSHDEHTDMLIVPATSSQRREYLPIGYVSEKNIVSYSLMLIPNASNFNFGILESKVHYIWLKNFCGRLKSDYRYSNTIIYNNFPWPTVGDKQEQNISETAQGILNTRKLYPDSSLADLYDPLTMPVELRKAHEANDKAVLKAYGLKPSVSEDEIVQHLFKLYEELTRKDKRNHE